MSYFGLNKSNPVHVLFFDGRARDQHNKMLIAHEKVPRLENGVPYCLAFENLLTDVVATLYLVDHDRAR